MLNKKNKQIRLIKVSTDFQLTDVVLKEPFIIGEALYGKGSSAVCANINYDVLLENLKMNKIYSNFTMLVDEDATMKEEPVLNFVGSLIYKSQIFGDVYFVKVGKDDFVDMFDREYEVLKTQLLGLIDIVTQELSKDADNVD